MLEIFHSVHFHTSGKKQNKTKKLHYRELACKIGNFIKQTTLSTISFLGGYFYHLLICIIPAGAENNSKQYG